MENINTYILEKLKISNKEEVTANTTVTYLDFYNKINRYCRSNGCKNFTVGVVDKNSKPEFLYNDNSEIRNIWPINGSNLKLTFRIINPDARTYELQDIIVTGNEDKLVDFISPEWVDKIMKYLKVY